MFFVHILPWTQIHSHQFDAATLLKIKIYSVEQKVDLLRSIPPTINSEPSLGIQTVFL